MRFGLISNYKRSWSAIGKRTVIANQQEYSNRYLYSAIDPITGDNFHILGFPDVNASITKIFLEALVEKYKDNHILMVWDNAPFHKSKILHSKENISILTLPSYGQELNPTERFFGEMRKATANKIHKDIEAIEKLLHDEVVIWINDKDRTKGLIFWDYMKKQLNIIDS